MRLALAAIAAFAALVAAIVIVAVSSASGTPGGTVLGGHALGGGARLEHRPPPACVFQDRGGPSAISMNGECTGELTGVFRCVKTEDGMAVSIRKSLTGGNVFYLTFLVPKFVRPGRYPESEAVIQVSGRADPPRWAVREAVAEEAITIVTDDGSVELGTFGFEPEPGTSATSAILVGGHAKCAATDWHALQARNALR